MTAPLSRDEIAAIRERLQQMVAYPGSGPDLTDEKRGDIVTAAAAIEQLQKQRDRALALCDEAEADPEWFGIAGFYFVTTAKVRAALGEEGK